MANEPHGNIYVIILTILGTIVIMIVSAMFTISNIKRVWWLGSVKKKRAAAAAAANRENNEKKEQQNNVGCSSYKEKKEDARRSQVNREECVATATKNNGTKSSCE